MGIKLPNVSRDRWIHQNREELDEIFQTYLKDLNPDFNVWVNWLYIHSRDLDYTVSLQEVIFDEDDEIIEDEFEPELHRIFEAVRNTGIAPFLASHAYPSFCARVST